MLNLGTTDKPKSIPTRDMISGGGGGGGSALIEFDEDTETISIAPAEARFMRLLTMKQSDSEISSWSSGTVTVEGSAGYTAFALKTSGIEGLIHCYKNGSHVRGVTGYPSPDGSYMITLEFEATVSGEDWTYVMCANRRHNTDGHGNGTTGRTITAIYGEY